MFYGLDSQLMGIFVQNGGPIEQKIFKEKFITAPSFQEAIDILKNQPSVAMVWPGLSVKSMLTTDICDYKVIPTIARKLPTSFYVQQNWPFKDLLNFQ